LVGGQGHSFLTALINVTGRPPIRARNAGGFAPVLVICPPQTALHEEQSHGGERGNIGREQFRERSSDALA